MKFRLTRSLMLFSALSCAGLCCITACSGASHQTDESQSGDISVSTAASETGDGTSVDSSVLESLNGISFTYSGSAGNWETKITFGSNGSFTGTYKDTEKNMTGKGYSKGTVYTSSFSGRFSVTSQTDKLSYDLSLDELALDDETGTETIEKKVRYITTNAYGLNQGDSFTLYMAGYKSSSLPDDFRDIITSSRELYDGMPSQISFCGLYNAVTKSGFTSDNYLETAADNANTAYLNILTYYQNDIERYNWEYSAHTRPTALCDINGDGIDEFLFFTSEKDTGPGILHIYTYADGQAQEVTYPFDDINDGSDSSLMFTDVSTGTGTSYVIYKDKDENALWIYRRGGDADSVNYMLYEYTLDENGKLEEKYTLKKTSTENSSGVSAVTNAMPILGEYYDGSYDNGSGDGSYSDGSYDDGSYDNGSDDSYDDGSYDDGSYDDGSYDDGSYGDDSYDDGSYDDGSYDYDYDNDYSYDYNYSSGSSVDGISSSGGTFTENGKEVTGEEGAQAFRDGFDKVGEVLLTSTETTDVSIWDKFTNDDVKGLSYADMAAKLGGK